MYKPLLVQYECYQTSEYILLFYDAENNMNYYSAKIDDDYYIVVDDYDLEIKASTECFLLWVCKLDSDIIQFNNLSKTWKGNIEVYFAPKYSVDAGGIAGEAGYIHHHCLYTKVLWEQLVLI